MSDWIEEIITHVKTEEFNCYLDLFEFNGFNPPKFWFGDRVKWGDRTGVVLGLGGTARKFYPVAVLKMRAGGMQFA